MYDLRGKMEIGDSERFHVTTVTMVSIYANFWDMGYLSKRLNIIKVEVSEDDDKLYIWILGENLRDWLGGWSIGEQECFHKYKTFLDSTN